MASITSIAPLTKLEEIKRDNLELRVEKNLGAIADAAEALLQIKTEGLWRPHESWEAYIETRWSFGKRHANRLINLAKINAANEAQGVPQVPTERIARELARLPEDERSDCWADALKLRDGKPTAEFVRTLVDSRLEVIDAPSRAVESRDPRVSPERTSFDDGDDSPVQEVSPVRPAPERDASAEAERIADCTRQNLQRDYRMLPVASRARWFELVREEVEQIGTDLGISQPAEAKSTDLTTLDIEAAISLIDAEADNYPLGSTAQKKTWIAMLKKALLDPHRMPSPWRVSDPSGMECQACETGIAVAINGRRGMVSWVDVHEALS